MFSELTPPDRPRAQLRAQLLGLGTPPAHIDAIVDIACQAADQAFRSALRAVDLLHDDRERMTAIGIVWSLIMSDAQRGIDGLKAAADEFGMKTDSFSIRSGGHG